jgi:carboxylate-amine ligase
LIREILEFVDDVAGELGTSQELAYIERILEDGTGADRQLRVYRDTGDFRKVVDYMVSETELGLFNGQPLAAGAGQ